MPDTVVREVKRYVRDIDQRLDEGRGIWFVGDVGTGKTTLAMLVSKAAIDAGRSVAIYSRAAAARPHPRDDVERGRPPAS